MSDHRENIIGATDLCQFYGINRTTLQSWIGEGAPVENKHMRGKGRKLLFDSTKIAKWRESKAVHGAGISDGQLTKNEASRRKTQAEAELAELEVAKKKGAVVDIDELELKLKHRFAQFMTSMRKIPERVAMQLINADEDQIKAILLEEIDRSLNVLADGVLVDDRD